MNVDQFRELLSKVKYKDWQFTVGEDGDRPYLQLKFAACDSKTGEETHWSARKWFLSPHMTPSEVIQTAFKAVLTAEEHEAREQFQYRCRAIFGPHFNVDKLWEVADGSHEQTRMEM